MPGAGTRNFTYIRKVFQFVRGSGGGEGGPCRLMGFTVACDWMSTASRKGDTKNLLRGGGSSTGVRCSILGTEKRRSSSFVGQSAL